MTRLETTRGSGVDRGPGSAAARLPKNKVIIFVGLYDKIAAALGIGVAQKYLKLHRPDIADMNLRCNMHHMTAKKILDGYNRLKDEGRL